jgi:hypothetical protein
MSPEEINMSPLSHAISHANRRWCQSLINTVINAAARLATLIALLGLLPATTALAQPVQPMVATGDSHTVALYADGSIWAWGRNNSGQLGDGTVATRLSPVRIGNNTTWTSIAAGAAYTVARRADGSLWAWGFNGTGQLGMGDTSIRFVPTQIGSNMTWTSVATGQDHTVALRADGIKPRAGRQPDHLDICGDRRLSHRRPAR